MSTTLSQKLTELQLEDLVASTKPAGLAPQSAEENGGEIEFRIVDLARQFIDPIASGHCGGCDGCKGCSHAA